MKQGRLFNRIDDFDCVSQLTAEEISKLNQDFGETCALMVLDSTGFTRITREKGSLFYLYHISNMRRKCRELFPEFNAIDFRFHADNAFAEFESVQQAIDFAAAITRYFAEEQISLGNEIFQSCIGIGYGPVVRCDIEGVFGDEMNVTCKLGEDVAEAGEILLTENAFKNCDVSEDQTDVRTVSVSGVDLNCYKLLNLSPY